jgi:hypothetical protein
LREKKEKKSCFAACIINIKILSFSTWIATPEHTQPLMWLSLVKAVRLIDSGIVSQNPNPKKICPNARSNRIKSLIAPRCRHTPPPLPPLSKHRGTYALRPKQAHGKKCLDPGIEAPHEQSESIKSIPILKARRHSKTAIATFFFF